MRKTEFSEGEFYHVYNRGNNKRPIFNAHFDLDRFLLCIQHFNGEAPIGSIYQNSFKNRLPLGGSTSKSGIVEVVAYCLNPNHFHLILKQLAPNGIQKFMHKLGTGYTMYFNDKYKSSGALFQGRYKAIHVDSNEYLLHLSAYVNLNSEAHQNGKRDIKSMLSRSSWSEYVSKQNHLCNKDIVLAQFKGIRDYERFAKDSLGSIKHLKDSQRFVLESLNNT